MKVTRPYPEKKKRRPRRRRNVTYCDCGKPAIAHLKVKAGLEGCYTVTLHLCQDCLALEKHQFPTV